MVLKTKILSSIHILLVSINVKFEWFRERRYQSNPDSYSLGIDCQRRFLMKMMHMLQNNANRTISLAYGQQFPSRVYTWHCFWARYIWCHQNLKCWSSILKSLSGDQPWANEDPTTTQPWSWIFLLLPLSPLFLGIPPCLLKFMFQFREFLSFI